MREGFPNNPHNIGARGTRLFLIGGMTPRYLVGTIPQEMREHIGSTDLDIVVGISLATEEAEAYRTLQQNLRAVQFAPARNPDTGQEETFRWERNVDGVRVLLEFFSPVGAGQPGQLLRNPGENVGSKISAVRTRGAELAGLDHFEVTLNGELLDHGGIQEAVIARVPEDDVLRNRRDEGKIVLPCRPKFPRRDKSFFQARFAAASISVQAIRWTPI